VAASVSKQKAKGHLMFAAHAMMIAGAPPLLDVVGTGTGAVGPAGTTWTANYTVTAGSYVIGLINTFSALPGSVKYGGTAMTFLGSVTVGTSINFSAYGFPNAPGSAQAFSGNRPSNGSWRANVISLLNVGAVDTVSDTTSGASGAASHSVPCSIGQRILQVFAIANTAGTTMSSLSGGQNLTNANSLIANTALIPTTFAGTASAAWGSLALRLN
jgi:hypothetical protein